MERLILARHGESEYSSRGLLNGDPSRAVGIRVEHARPHAFTRDELERSLAVLEAWRASPTW